MAHFYLGHGLGLDSAEAPYVGTDLGDGVRRALVLAAGMVLVHRADRVGRGRTAATGPRTCSLVTDDGW